MTMTIEISNDLARRLQAAATAKGVPVQDFVSQALTARLIEEPEQSARPASDGEVEKPWMRYFGIWSDLKEELAEINRIIEEEFEAIEPEDWE